MSSRALAVPARLVKSSVPCHVSDVRSFYMKDWNLLPGPVIGASRLVPKGLIEVLMREKKDSALAVKYRPGDAITNMEGALHCLVVPVVPVVYMHGDYIFNGCHTVPAFPTNSDKHMARPVVMSALVQLDFEFSNVIFKLIALQETPVVGKRLDWSLLTRDQKNHEATREQYDREIKEHLVYAFTPEHQLPAVSQVTVSSKSEIIKDIRQGRPSFFESQGSVLSIQMLSSFVEEQIRAEHAALANVCPEGYVYTWDPPAIFARTLDPDIIDELWVAALAKVDSRQLKCVAFNDYRNPHLLKVLRLALPKSVQVTSKTTLFTNGVYSPSSDLEQYPLVVHNNSDGFGQNIETEPEFSSLDGALGARSSAAASLHRQRPDLVDEICWVS